MNSIMKTDNRNWFQLNPVLIKFNLNFDLGEEEKEILQC